MADELYFGLDIGSSTIRIAVCSYQVSTSKEGSLHLIGAVEAKSAGVHKGSISSLEEAVGAISKALEKSERLTGVVVNHAWVAISGQNILVQSSQGVVAVSRPQGEIEVGDVERVMEAARTVATPTNYEILHVIPKSFTIDGQSGIKDPVGMSGIRLEVDAVIIEALSSHIRSLTRSVYRTGLEIDDLVYAPLATAEAVLTPKQKELGVCVVSIGSATTTLAIFEEGDLLHTAVIPIGGDHITSDIAIALRISIDSAEEIKRSLGTALPEALDRREQLALKDYGVDSEEQFKPRFVAEVIEARLEEICEGIDTELQAVDRSGLLPIGVIFTGGAFKLPGSLELAKRVLRLPCAFGTPQGIESVLDEVADPAFATAIGLALWGRGVKEQNGQKWNPFKGIGAGWLKSVGILIKTWFRRLSP